MITTILAILFFLFIFWFVALCVTYSSIKAAVDLYPRLKEMTFLKNDSHYYGMTGDKEVIVYFQNNHHYIFYTSYIEVFGYFLTDLTIWGYFVRRKYDKWFKNNLNSNNTQDFIQYLNQKS